MSREGGCLGLTSSGSEYDAMGFDDAVGGSGGEVRVGDGGASR